jgi:uncharacterized protein
VNSAFNQERPAESDQAPWLPQALIAPWQEIVLVVAVIIGFSTIASSWQAWHGSSGNYVTSLLTDGRMVRTLAMESAILGLLFVHLKRRGWRPADLRIQPTWPASGLGLLLIPGMMVANSITVVIGFVILYFLQARYGHFAAFVLASGPALKFHTIHVSWLAVIPALMFNGFFEEITCMGYAFNQFAAKRGPVFALALTVALRMSCHTYQGVIHALGIGAAFSVFGLVYIFTRNLWPLILAHIIVDMLSFGAIKFFFG